MRRKGNVGKHEYEHKKRLRVDRIIYVMLILVCIGVVILNIRKSIFKSTHIEYVDVQIDDMPNVETLSTDYEISNLPDITLSISAIGDIMCHNTQYMDAYRNGTYDFSHVFEDIKKYIEPADLAIGNLETTLAGSQIGYSSYPTFNTPEALATDLKELGIDVLSTANNHSLDKGYVGIDNTIKELDKAGVFHAGTYNSEESYNTPLILDVKGLKVAYMAYTYGTNGISIPSGKEYCINLINKDKIMNDLSKIKEFNPDLIIAQMHWGNEYQTNPCSEQEELADFLFSNGVDIILGSHPHILQKMEKRNVVLDDGTEKECFVIYSLGNFVSGQYQPYTRQSIILDINLTRVGNTGKILINSVNYTPIYTFKGNRYRILDIENVIENYNNGNRTYDSSTISTLKTELQQVYSKVGDEIK